MKCQRRLCARTVNLIPSEYQNPMLSLASMKKIVIEPSILTIYSVNKASREYICCGDIKDICDLRASVPVLKIPNEKIQEEITDAMEEDITFKPVQCIGKNA